VICARLISASRYVSLFSLFLPERIGSLESAVSSWKTNALPYFELAQVEGPTHIDFATCSPSISCFMMCRSKVFRSYSDIDQEDGDNYAPRMKAGKIDYSR